VEVTNSVPPTRLIGSKRPYPDASLRPRAEQGPVIFATTTALRALGRRVVALDDETKQLDNLLAELLRVTAPQLVAVYGVGPDTAAWAHLCGVAPIGASSGKVKRYRLNRGGDRQANAALWRIVITRMSSDPRTQAYVARRIRVLKRYVAREVYRYLRRP
jgi:transposase